MAKKKSKALIIVILILLVGSVGGYFAIRYFSQGVPRSGDVVYMQKVSDFTGTVTTVDRYAGTVEAQRTQNFKKDPERSVEEIYVQVGQVVEEGTPLFKYDIRSAQNNIESLKLDIEGINNDIALLRNSGTSTEIQLQISEKELEVKQKQADINRYQQEIDQSEVKSNIAGKVKSISMEGGYDSAGQEIPVVAVTETGEFRIKGKVSEQSIGTITQGQPVIVRSRVDENQTWNGKITKIETEPDTNNENNYWYGGDQEKASNYPFYITLTSTKGLMLGQHVFIEPDYGQMDIKEGLWLMMDFIAYDDSGQAYVWSAHGNRAARQYVELGEIDEDTYTVEILSGLSEDDLIAWPDETITEGKKIYNMSEDA